MEYGTRRKDYSIPILATCHPERKHRAKGLCSKCYALQHRAKHYERIRPKEYIEHRRRELIRKYNLTLEDYDKMAAAQGHVCMICKNPPKIKAIYRFKRGLVVDHCHTTGKIRGLLCDRCNKSLGGFKDSLELLKAAVKYLELTSDTIVCYNNKSAVRQKEQNGNEKVNSSA